MKKVITYGTYDLLHQGHLNILRRAKELGDYLIVGVTSDSFDKGRGKLNVRNNVLERVEAVKATGYANEIIIEDYVGQKIDDIQKYNVDIFAIGSDWKGKFDYLNEYVKVVYLPRTEGISSTMLRAEATTDVRMGIIGCGRIAKRFPSEADVVNAIKIVATYDIEQKKAEELASNIEGAMACETIGELYDAVDAVYVATPHMSHYHHIKNAINAGKHVLCETPMVLKKNEAKELFALAEKNHIILMEANKTAHCPAFNHLMVMIKSGIIGEVVDIEASLSQLLDKNGREFDAKQAGGALYEQGCFLVWNCLSGELYLPTDEEIFAEQIRRLDMLYDFNATRPTELEKRRKMLRGMFAEIGEGCYIEPPLHANHAGANVHFGKQIYANFNLTLVDDTHIYVGDCTMFGPNVTVATAGHPILPELREKAYQYNMPVRIGRNCWIGAGAIILPGVTIGDNTVIGAGSVVTKDIPANVVAVGNPCRVLREIGEKDREYYFRDRKIPKNLG